MPRSALTDAKIRKAKAKEKQYTLFDGGRLFLLVTTTGSKLWRLAFNLAGKDRLFAIGPYPEVSLQEARQARDEAKRLIKRGIDPVHHRKAEKAKAAHAACNTFGVVAAAYVENAKVKQRAESTIALMELLVRNDAATLADRPIASITSHEILTLQKAVNERAPTMAVKLRGFLSSVFRFAIANCYCETDPTTVLRGAIAVPPQEHFPAIIDPVEFGKLLRAVEAYDCGLAQTGFALRLAPHLAVRPAEMRKARWSEIDFDKAVWVIPAERMKKRREHAVPLSRQVLALLTELRAITGTGEFLFPGRNSGRSLSDATLNVALCVMGYKGTHTMHGWRSSFSSMANTAGLWSEDAIERQLAHADKNATRGAYMRDPFFDERVRLMQWWSDRIDEMRIADMVSVKMGELK